MTVARLQTEMTALEWRAWNVFYARRGQREELEALKARARAGRRRR
jgi:hypothetical protein